MTAIKSAGIPCEFLIFTSKSGLETNGNNLVFDSSEFESVSKKKGNYKRKKGSMKIVLSVIALMNACSFGFIGVLQDKEFSLSYDMTEF